MAVLNEKDVPYDIRYIDLRNKPEWFLEISPTGKVPVIQLPSGDTLFESAVINEYLDEVHEPRFMAESPLDRAKERMWGDFVSGLYGDTYRLYNAENEEDAQTAVAKLRERLETLETAIVGPLFSGEKFSLVDATAAPPFTRMDWIQRIEPSIDPFVGLPKATVWRDALLARESVQNSVLPEIFEIFTAGLKRNDTWLASKLS